MTITGQTAVGSVATQHPLTTRVFARHGIDFCCGGGRPLSEACEARGVDTEAVLAELADEIQGRSAEETRWDERPMTELIDHIVATFHVPLREELPRLEAMARKVYDVHGDKDPERLKTILETVGALKAELLLHMGKEEEVLFPMIAAGQGRMAMAPVSVMEAEHAGAGEMLRRLSELTDQYTPPPEACNTWRALWAGLEDLETAMHIHIHLENNILFPRALES
jgi:regulator of cell morphogenesis and NO signaling